MIKVARVKIFSATQMYLKPLTVTLALIPGILGFSGSQILAASPPTETPGARYSVAGIVDLLESGAIVAGASDRIFQQVDEKLVTTRVAGYEVFHVQGLDVTDYILLLSKDGKFFYAHYASCSESKTYFKKNSEYLQYLSVIRQNHTNE